MRTTLLSTLVATVYGGGFGRSGAGFLVRANLLRLRFLGGRFGDCKILGQRSFQSWHCAIRCSGSLWFVSNNLGYLLG